MLKQERGKEEENPEEDEDGDGGEDGDGDDAKECEVNALAEQIEHYLLWATR